MGDDSSEIHDHGLNTAKYQRLLLEVLSASVVMKIKSLTLVFLEIFC